VRIAQLGDPAEGPTSADIRARAIAARKVQLARTGNEGEPNARVPVRALRDVAALENDARTLLSTASERLGLSARAATRVLRVARTIADLEAEAQIATAHVAEAIGYRTPGVS
jgi:magnesium chelatase family protein